MSSSGPHASTAAAIVTLALAFHREPNRFLRQWRDGSEELPAEGLDLMLRLAGSTSTLPEECVAVAGTETHRLKKAARFFVEQALMAPDADHYRLLGLRSAASNAQIREHRRLLLRLFHPDRAVIRQPLANLYAERINQACALLLQPETRHAYDQKLEARRVSARPPSRRRRGGGRVNRSGETNHRGALSGRFVRLLPSVLLAAIACIALIVLARYLLWGSTP